MPAPDSAGIMRFSTADYPERERAAICHDFFGRTIVGVEFAALEGQQLDIHAALQRVDDLQISVHSSSGMTIALPPDMIRNDDVVLTSTSLKAWHSWQFGRETWLGRGDALLTSNSDPGRQIQPEALHGFAVRMPRHVLFPLIDNPTEAFGRRIPGENGALRLLFRYLSALNDCSPLEKPGLRQAARNHILDLVTVALGATRDAAVIARARGVRAALLREIKTDIESLIEKGDLSVEQIAMRHRLTTRYVQRLFESDGSSFTDFTRDLRLTRAWRMLRSPTMAGHKVSDIAYATGFNDLSYFNRVFRRRFGMTPSEARERFDS